MGDFNCVSNTDERVGSDVRIKRCKIFKIVLVVVVLMMLRLVGIFSYRITNKNVVIGFL